MKSRPVADQIIVKKITERVAVELLKVDVPVELAREGIVVSIGEGRRLDSGELVPLGVKVGDRVVFSEEDARQIPENGDVYFILAEGKILRHSRQKEELPLSAADLFPDEKADLREEILELVEDPETWLDTPHPRLGWKKPKDLIGAHEEQPVRDLVRSIRYVGIT